MGKRDKRVDARIASSAEFAQPILEHLRGIVHEACPTVEESIKWSHPTFMYNGRILCSMAAFKNHATFGFWDPGIVEPGDRKGDEPSMGSFGRLASVKDLPPKKKLSAYIKKAMTVQDSGAVQKRPLKHAPRSLDVPPALAAAFKKNKSAASHFEAFSPTNKRDYIEWISDAKTDETRDKRVAIAIEWLSDGKTRHWKYQRKS